MRDTVVAVHVCVISIDEGWIYNMGLLNALFGGGTKLELVLDSSEVPAGGQLSGHVRITGGKKPYKMSSVFVRLLHVSATSKPDKPLPEITIKLLVDSVIATNEELPPGVEKRYSFRFAVPIGLEPTALSVSYTVLAQADIPGVADPKDESKLKIIESRGSGICTIEEVKARYPGLDATDEDEFEEALRSLDNDCYSQREQLIAAEPLLAETVRTGSTQSLRRAALSAWSNLVDGQVRKEHLTFLSELVNSPAEQGFYDEVIEAAARFAEEGALPIVKRLAASGDPHVRAEMARQLRFNAKDRFPGKRELLESMLDDDDGEVRGAAVSALSEWRNDPQLMKRIAGLVNTDPAIEVKKAGIACVALVHHYGSGTLALDVYERHLSDPDEEVKKSIAEALHWLPETESPRVYGMVQKLASDTSGEVRRVMAFQFHNLSDFRQLLPLALHMLENDPSETVRAEALGGVSALLDPEAACQLAERYLRSSPSDRMLWGVLDLLRHHAEFTRARALLQELARGGADVARAARAALEA